MSNDRHNADMAQRMAAAAAREPLTRDDRRREQQALDHEHIDDREHPYVDDPNRPHLDEHGYIDAREMAGQRPISDQPEVSDDRPMPMFAGAESAGYRTQWDAIQTGFVDEPRKAVQEADALVALVIKRLSEVFTQERSSLEGQWGKGDEISTEDLRLALRRYRSFFERLLSL